jgi:hypothetical protein
MIGTQMNADFQDAINPKSPFTPLFQRGERGDFCKCLAFPLPQETRLTFRGAASQMAAQATEKRTVATTKARK